MNFHSWVSYSRLLWHMFVGQENSPILWHSCVMQYLTQTVHWAEYTFLQLVGWLHKSFSKFICLQLLSLSGYANLLWWQCSINIKYWENISCASAWWKGKYELIRFLRTTKNTSFFFKIKFINDYWVCIQYISSRLANRTLQ